MDLVRMIRYANASVSVALYEQAILRNRRGLERALIAKSEAEMDLIIHRHPRRDPEPPSYLLKRKPK